ncbi:MAG: metallophosphoesterase [Bacillota bacterium]
MALYAIADLHLSLNTDKPMHVFGEQWFEHHHKIEAFWRETITEEDVTLIPGDISWAMGLDEAMVDLTWIHKLPGKKVLLRGNHDYWWGSISKMNQLFEDIYFLQNNFFPYKNYGVCGTRGWICPNDYKFDEQDEKVYKRELLRLSLSLEAAKKMGYKDLIVMTHYPPTNDKLEDSGFTEIFENAGVKKVIYGHLHGEDSFNGALQGVRNGVAYQLVSCDYLHFKPIKILE